MIPFDQVLVQIVNGLVNGMILALVASGLTLIFGIMDIVNFAHGDLFMLGAYIGTTAYLTTGINGDRRGSGGSDSSISVMALMPGYASRQSASKPWR